VFNSATLSTAFISVMSMSAT